jgi:hypothetical protein
MVVSCSYHFDQCSGVDECPPGGSFSASIDLAAGTVTIESTLPARAKVTDSTVSWEYTSTTGDTTLERRYDLSRVSLELNVHSSFTRYDHNTTLIGSGTCKRAKKAF